MAEVSNSTLFQIDTGILPTNACVVILRTDWNAGIVGELEKGCRRILEHHGVTVKTYNVPGAFELTFAARQLWDICKYRDDKPHAIVAMGCVLRGDTPHFEYVSQAVTSGITQLNLQLPIPTIFGVLTVDNHLQAEERIGGIHGHKGEEAGYTALKMMSLPKLFKANP
ncbi:MAG: 6,7-dimethyl-8-ribityllumazine synthase [Flavitalea sp.]